MDFIKSRRGIPMGLKVFVISGWVDMALSLIVEIFQFFENRLQESFKG
jgi:hypothetical protein